MTLATICHDCGTTTTEANNGRCPTCKPAHDKRRNAAPTRAAHRHPQHLRVKAIVWARDPHHCVDCHTTHDLTLDYIVPLIAGGRMHQDNACIRCRSCNSSKGGTVTRGRR